jgi:hypothetical protein
MTVDGGQNWLSQDPGTNECLNAVRFTDVNTGYAVGEHGTIIKTNDGGLHWEKQFSCTTADLEAICFLEADNGYVVGWHGAVLKTSNGGVVGVNRGSAASESLRIYPNPADGIISINVSAKSRVTIVNMEGQRIMERTINYPSGQIDISRLPSGVYFIKVTGEKKVKIGKIVKR